MDLPQYSPHIFIDFMLRELGGGPENNSAEGGRGQLLPLTAKKVYINQNIHFFAIRWCKN